MSKSRVKDIELFALLMEQVRSVTKSIDSSFCYTCYVSSTLYTVGGLLGFYGVRFSLSLRARSRIDVLPDLGLDSRTIIAFLRTPDFPLGVTPYYLGVFDDTIEIVLAALDFGLYKGLRGVTGVDISLNIDGYFRGVLSCSFALEFWILF